MARQPMRIFYFDEDSLARLPEKFNVFELADVAGITERAAKARVADAEAEGVLFSYGYRGPRNAKLYSFTEQATATDRRRLVAMSTPDQERMLLQQLPDEFSTRHINARIHQHDNTSMRRFLQNIVRKGLVEPAGRESGCRMIWRKVAM